MSACKGCPYEGSVQVPGYGSGSPAFCVVGEAPGAQEVAEMRPFVGQSGKLLRAMIEEVGGDPEDVYYTNVVRCRPPNNVTPDPKAIHACMRNLTRELKDVDTKLVVALGKTAHEAMGLDWRQMGVAVDQGGWHLLGGWHPAYVLRQPVRASEFKLTIDRAVNGPVTSPINREPDVRWARTLGALRAHLELVPNDTMVAFDIETDQVQWYDSRERKHDPILMLQISWDEEFAIIVTQEMLYDVVGVIDYLQYFFDRVRTCAHNGKFDAVFQLAHLNLHIHQDFDTMLARHVLDESLPMGLKTIVRLELGMPDYEDEMISKYLKSKNDFYSKIPPDELAKYGAIDVVATLYLEGFFRKKLIEAGQLEWPFEKVIMPAANAFVHIEHRGMYVDEERLIEVEAELGVSCDQIEASMQELTGKAEFNPRSPKQVAVYFYDDLGFPERKIYNKGPRTTGKEALEELKGRHPIIGMMKEYRRVHKMRTSYARNVLKQMDPEGFVHADFKITGTEVGRISVARPALQTIPRADDYYGALIKSSFTAPPGYKLIEVDFSQAELRVLACLSDEGFLQQVYRDGRDLHSEVAIAMYGEGFTKAQRVQTKMFNFSYTYGGSEYSFAKDAGLSLSVAKRFVRDYNAQMPKLAQYRKDQVRFLHEHGYVATRFGRRRHFPLITSGNKDDARKASVHMPVAGGASDLTLMSANELVLEHNVWVCNLVHDSVMAYALIEEAKETAQLIADVMRAKAMEFFPEVPWPMRWVDEEGEGDIEIKDRWAEPFVECSVCGTWVISEDKCNHEKE